MSDDISNINIPKEGLKRVYWHLGAAKSDFCRTLSGRIDRTHLDTESFRDVLKIINGIEEIQRLIDEMIWQEEQKEEMKNVPE